MRTHGFLNLALCLLLACSGATAVSAKTASGLQSASPGLQQLDRVVNLLWHQGKIPSATTAASDSLDAARGTASVLDDAASAVTKVVRDPAQKRAFLRELAEHPNTPSWQRQWLREGRNPPGYDVDHIKPLSIGGADAPSNMHLILRSDHRLHHKFYRPWEN